MGFQQEAKTEVVDAGVVAGDGEVGDGAITESEDEGLRNAAQSEAAYGESHAVF
jgi:hypothetical protein